MDITKTIVNITAFGTGALLAFAAVANATPQITDPECGTQGNYTMCIAQHDSLQGFVVFTAQDRTSKDYYVQITDCNQSRFKTSGTITGIDRGMATQIARKSCKKYNLVPSQSI